MSQVSDEVLRSRYEANRKAGERGDPAAAEQAELYGELLQRRRDGNTPEEFVTRMAAQTGNVESTHVSDWLHQLSLISSATRHIRQIQAHFMKRVDNAG